MERQHSLFILIINKRNQTRATSSDQGGYNRDGATTQVAADCGVPRQFRSGDKRTYGHYPTGLKAVRYFDCGST
ncbi:hypothetical protein D3C80_1291930 [compost metagenome]